MPQTVGKYAWLTVAVAVVTLAAKLLAAYLTGSVGLFSDAMESMINLASSATLVIALRIAKSPPDPDHPFGHDKAEYFANGVQGTLILLAAAGILAAAIERLQAPRMLESGSWGIGLALGATVLNFLTAKLLLNRAVTLRSEALRGEALHLMSDVWTSVAVVAGVVLVYFTQVPWLDPVAALLVSVWIFVTGVRLISSSVKGLMDTALPAPSQETLIQILERYKSGRGIDYHALRSRVSGARIFVSVHILVPGAWTVKRGHALLDELEASVAQELPGATMLTHLEPLEEESSFQDTELPEP